MFDYCTTIDDQYNIIYDFKTTLNIEYCNIINIIANLDVTFTSLQFIVYLYVHVNTLNYSDKAWSLDKD